MICKQREDLREWEQKLQESEERLAESRRLLNQREQRANENDKIWKLKEKELEDAQRKIDDTKLALKKEEEEIGKRSSTLASMEKASLSVVPRLLWLFVECLLSCDYADAGN